MSYRKSREGFCRTLKPQECTVKKSWPKLLYIFIHFLMPSRPRAHNSTHTPGLCILDMSVIFLYSLTPSKVRTQQSEVNAFRSEEVYAAGARIGRKAREQQAYRLRGELREGFAVAAATNVIVSHVNETLQCHVRHTVVQHCLPLESEHDQKVTFPIVFSFFLLFSLL